MNYYTITQNGIDTGFEFGEYSTKKTAILVLRQLRNIGTSGILGLKSHIA